MRSTDFETMKEKIAATFDAAADSFKATLDELKSKTESSLRADLNALNEDLKRTQDEFNGQLADIQSVHRDARARMEEIHNGIETEFSAAFIARRKTMLERRNWLERKLAELTGEPSPAEVLTTLANQP